MLGRLGRPCGVSGVGGVGRSWSLGIGPGRRPRRQSAPTDQDAAQAPRFKSAVDLVSVSAVVRDKKGRFVPHLSREDFIVVEGGERRPIVGFNAEADGPVKVAVLFDISGSMRVGTKAVDAQQAARHLFSSLKAGDQAALFAFDTQLEKVTGFTTDFKGLESKVDKVEPPFGQTSLYDAIAETAKAVADIGWRQRPGAAAVGHRRPDRRHRYEEPADGAGSLGHREQHRCAGLHRRGDVAGRRPAESGLRHRGAEQRADGSGAVDRRRLLHRDLAGAREHRGAADRR